MSINQTLKPENLTHTWQWQTAQGMSYLTCSLLEPCLHGFFTKQFSPLKPDVLVKFLHKDAKAYFSKQVHGNNVIIPEIVKEADGIITEEANQAVWVASADCTPVLIADVTSLRVAAIHAGWRGTSKGIVKVAIARFIEYGSKLENLRIALGPAISGSVYQVGEEVATEVIATILPLSEDILDVAKKIPSPPILDDPEARKVKLDVRGVISLQLQQLGINQSQIAIAPYCTYLDAENFFSYRRTSVKLVQWSGIISG